MGHKSKLNNSTVMVVLGMHRSGTSALAGALSFIGVDFGSDDKLIGSSSDSNIKGHWEHQEIVLLNEQLLSVLGSSWDDFRVIEESDFLSGKVDEIKAKILKVLKKDFQGSKLWGLKDPRICKLLPFWNQVFQEFGVSPLYAHIYRHPDEVADSLKKRNGFTKEKSQALWLAYTLSAEKYSRSFPRIHILYESLLKDWHSLIGKINSHSNIGLHIDHSQADRVDIFLSPELRHSHVKYDKKDLTNKSWVYTTYRDLIELSTGSLDEKTLWSRLDPIYNLFSMASSLFGPMFYDQSSVWNELHIVRNKVSDLTSEYKHLEGAYRELEGAYKQTQSAYEQAFQAYKHDHHELEKIKS